MYGRRKVWCTDFMYQSSSRGLYMYIYYREYGVKMVDLYIQAKGNVKDNIENLTN